jgi:hypothetical protein
MPYDDYQIHMEKYLWTNRLLRKNRLMLWSWSLAPIFGALVAIPKTSLFAMALTVALALHPLNLP